MRIVIFTLAFMILLATSSLAVGLQITDLKFSVDYDQAWAYRQENADKINFVPHIANNSRINADVFPGSNVTFTVRIENTFSGSGPVLKNAIATVTVQELDDGADAQQESADFDLEPGDDALADLKFKIPFDVHSGTYNVKIRIEGEDINRTLYSAEENLKFGVRKQSHDLKIKSAFMNPGIVDCKRKSKITASFANIGSSLEDQIAFGFKSESLGINSIDRDISLGTSEENNIGDTIYTKNLNVEVPSSYKAGSYPIFVNLYWKNSLLFDKQEIDLIVKDCKTIWKNQNIGNQTTIETPTSSTQNVYQSKRPYSSVMDVPIIFFLIAGIFIVSAVVILIIFIRRNGTK